MRLETSLELLERLRARYGASYYRVAKMLEMSETAVGKWKSGKGGMGRDVALRVAALLDEPAEYVIACIEHDREPSAGVRRIWRRIAEAFRSKAAAITLIVSVALIGGGNPLPAQALARIVSPASDGPSIHYAHRGHRRRRRWTDRLLDWLLVPPSPAPAWRLV